MANVTSAALTSGQASGRCSHLAPGWSQSPNRFWKTFGTHSSSFRTRDLHAGKVMIGHVTVSGPVRKRISVWSLSHACQHSRKKRRFRNAVFFGENMRVCNQKCAFRPTPGIVFHAQRFRRFCARHAVFGFVRVDDFSGFGSSNVGFVPRRPVFSVPSLTFMRASNVLRSASELMHVLGLRVS